MSPQTAAMCHWCRCPLTVQQIIVEYDGQPVTVCAKCATR